ncbi:hypothetical protein KP509_10G008600 [Ceratopteris richardii]|uniref:Bifunctional inhibitor/plant lipid transfer protein/seed storage helical domain-containing protein n=1 Tax=Ceratopteris richardii TaxID=49495 RepID=A0A8T2TWF4_CERRI|nr:hypothetical protein KP509_10G008600 [Ceratopteris richardii]
MSGMTAWIVIVKITSTMLLIGVSAVRGPGCEAEDLVKVSELWPCLGQFYEPSASSLQRGADGAGDTEEQILGDLGCCSNSTSPCCHALRQALPVGDDCVCQFMRRAAGALAGKSFSLDITTALMHISSQCRVDFGTVSCDHDSGHP